MLGSVENDTQNILIKSTTIYKKKYSYMDKIHLFNVNLLFRQIFFA